MSAKEEYRVKDLNTNGGANRFKFKSFSERISAMRVDVFHKVQSAQLAPDTPSFFQDGIVRWKELNQTGHFNDFVREVNPYKNSLPQILFHKEKIVQMLVKHLSVEGSLATAPLLDLIATLARDLRQEFYPFFPAIFSALQNLLANAGSNAILIESAFACLSYLFKFLQKQLTADLPKIFTLILPLLSHNRWYIRHFVAESFSFLVRRLEQDELSSPIQEAFTALDQDSQNNNLSQGISDLIFEIIRGPKPHFHSSALVVLRLAIPACRTGSAESRRAAMSRVYEKARRFTDKEHASPLWSAAFEEVTQTTQQKDNDSLAFAYVLLEKITSWRQGNLVSDSTAILSALKSALPSTLSTVFPAALNLLSAVLLNTKALQSHSVHCRNLLNAALAIPDASLVLPWLLMLRSLPQFGSLCWETAITYVSKHCTAEPDVTLSFFLELASEASDRPPMPSVLPNGRVRCAPLMALAVKIMQRALAQKDSAVTPLVKSSTPKKTKRAKEDETKAKEIETVEAEESGTSAVPPSRLWLALGCIALLDSDKTTLSALQLAVSALAKRPHSRANRFLLATAVSAITAYWRDYGQVQELRGAIQEITGLVIAFPKEQALVAAVADFLELLQRKEEEDASVKKKGDDKSELTVRLRDALQENMASPVLALREATLRLLLALPHQPDAQALLAVFAAIYRAEMGLDQAREMAVPLTALENGAAVFPSDYLPLLLNFLLGLLWIKFAPVWTATQAPLTAFGRAHFNLYWGALFPRLCNPSLVNPPSSDVEHTESSDIAETFYAAIEAPYSAPAASVTQVLTSLWRNCATVANLVEKHSKQLVPEFFAFLSGHVRDFEAEEEQEEAEKHADVEVEIKENADEEDHDDDDEVGAKKKAKAKAIAKLPVVVVSSKKRAVTGERERETLSAKGATDRLLTWLSLFAQFRNPRGLFQSDKLHATFTKLLRKPNPRVQLAALKCLGTWRHDYITAYRERLEKLTGDDTYREELTALTSELTAGVVAEHLREGLLAVVIQLLFPKLLGRVGRSAKSGLTARRATVLSFFSGLGEMQLDLFFSLLFEPFHIATQSEAGTSVALSPTHQLSFLGILGAVFKQLGQRVLPRVANFVDLLMRLLEPALKDSSLHTIRTECIKRLSKLLSIFPDFNHSIWVGKFFKLLKEPISRLANESHSAPSPLLLLLLEIGETPKLAMLFELDLTVLKSVLALFGSPLLARPVAALLADFVHQLLLNAEIDKAIEKLVTPHVPALLSNLHALLVLRGNSKKASIISQSRSEIALLSKLSKYASQPETASNLVDLLLPFLAPAARTDEDSKRNIVSIIGNSLRLLKEPIKHMLGLVSITWQHVVGARDPVVGVDPRVSLAYSAVILSMHSLNMLLYPLSRLLADSTDKETRASACASLAQLAAVVKDLQTVVPLLADTNAYLSHRMDEPDHEKRLDAFTRIEALAPSLNDVQLVPLLCNSFYFLPDPELSTRQIASGNLRALLSAAAAKMRADEAKDVARSKYTDVASRLVMPRLKTLITGNDANAREESLLALAHMVTNFPSLCGDLTPLRREDEPDADFFLNMTHIQRHRRTRALMRFAEFCKDGEPTRDHLTRIFVPLFTRLVMDSSEADHLVVDAAVAAVSAACIKLPWREYNTLLRAALKSAAKKPEQVRPLVKLVLGILGSFHFDASVEPEDDAAEKEKEKEKSNKKAQDAVTRSTAIAEKENHENNEDEEEEGEEEDEAAQLDKVALGRKISREIQQRVIPQLYALFAGEKTPVASMVSMGEGVAQLIKALPLSVRDAQVRRLTGELLVVLQKREAAARDAARRALCQAAVALGPSVLPFMVHEMRDVLKRGFQLHVLGHVANALLIALAPNLKPGDLDPVATILSEIYIEELTGELAEKKEVHAIAHSMRETKRSKANEAFEVLAKFLSLGALNKMLYPLQQAVLAAGSQKTLRKLEEALRHVGQGLSANASLTPAVLLSVIRGVVGGELDEEIVEQAEEEKERQAEAARETPVARAKRLADQAMLVAKSPRELKKAAAQAQSADNAHVMTEFGLWVFSSALKRSAFDFADADVAAQVAPFEGILLNALDSRHVKQTHTALKCIERLYHTTVPFLGHLLPRAMKRIFKILSRGTLAEQEAVNQAMRVLATLIRDSKSAKVTQEQLRWLCEYCLNNLESLERQSLAFNLLKAIVQKKLVVEEIYDLMRRVSQLIVQSQNPQVRLVCSQCLISFMLNYPLAPKRLQQHITGLLANLSYAYEDGRVAVLETIYAIIDKFPKEILHQQGEFFFVSLVPPLVGDDAEKCRRMTAAVIKRLLTGLDPNDLPPLLDLTLSWSSSSKAALSLAAAQVIGLFAEAAPAVLSKKPESLVPLMEALRTAPVPDGDEEEAVGAPDEWPLLYHLLISVEKLIGAGIAVSTYETLWSTLPTLMRHTHAWIRLLVCRLLGRCFALADAEVKHQLLSEGYWFELVRLHTRLLEDTKNEALGAQLLKNLVFLALFGQMHPRVTKKVVSEENDEKESDEDEDEDEEDEASEAKKEVDADAEGAKKKATEADKPLKWLVSRLSFIAKRGTPLQKRLVFMWTAALTARLEPAVLLGYLFRLLVPIFRVNESPEAPEELRNLAKEVLEVCKERVGLNPFWAEYNKVRAAAATVRMRRKQERKIQAAVDPERAAAKRVKKQGKKKELRKRRVVEMSGKKRFKKVRHAPQQGEEDSM